MSKSNPFIVIEALDAGGSQTQTNLLVRYTRRRGYKTLQLHFPQEDRPTGQFVYSKFLNTHNQPKFTRREQALIYIQDFYSRLPDIRRALQGPKTSLIISDRFCTSTMAYQTIGFSGASRRRLLQWMTALCYQGQPALPKPSLVVFLDTPPEISLAHLAKKPRDYFENKQKLTAIRRSYLRLAQEQKWAVINSVNSEGYQRPKADIHQEIKSILQSRRLIKG